MKYLGGKYRQGKEIAQVLKEYGEKHKIKKYIESFCGALGVAIRMVDDYNVHISDNHKDLIMLWKEVKVGKFKYPKTVSERTYNRFKKSNEPSAMRAFIGFGCSFGGKWFSSFAEDYNTNRISICNGTVSGLKKTTNKIKKIKKIKHQSYEKWKPVNCLIYCDPPYQNTTQYNTDSDFNHYEFWNKVRECSKNNIVIVSEYTAPKDFKCIWKKSKNFNYTYKISKKKYIEKLFIVV